MELIGHQTAALITFDLFTAHTVCTERNALSWFYCGPPPPCVLYQRRRHVCFKSDILLSVLLHLNNQLHNSVTVIFVRLVKL